MQIDTFKSNQHAKYKEENKNCHAFHCLEITIVIIWYISFHYFFFPVLIYLEKDDTDVSMKVAVVKQSRGSHLVLLCIVLFLSILSHEGFPMLLNIILKYKFSWL